ncbi:MAG: hypothetical protein WCS98_02085 [Bacillota bacterium]|jgi:hypothetical protein|nr:hypothetical protein [Bacillota bacterium]MDD3297865.1 hypothetical protein [Bacillota bacterium]MDD3850316.1 hypothetical protein [Bacillota bacterium]MDD4706988.1 hypothetical protein [Bacillota bacterium]
MAKKETKTGKKKKEQQDKQTTVRAMMDAKVPSACYELSVKPACHPMFKYESG